MGFARCGVEGNLRKSVENTRKTFPFFSFFVILKNGKSFLFKSGVVPEDNFFVAVQIIRW